MLKNILKLDGAQALNKPQQQAISGGCPVNLCPDFSACQSGCNGGYCFSGPIQPDGSVCYSCVRINIR